MTWLVATIAILHGWDPVRCMHTLPGGFTLLAGFTSELPLALAGPVESQYKLFLEDEFLSEP